MAKNNGNGNGKTLEELQETHAEMLATAHETGLEVPEELREEFTDVKAGGTICNLLDKMIKEHVASDDEEAEVATKETEVKKATVKKAKKAPAKKAAPKKPVAKAAPAKKAAAKKAPAKKRAPSAAFMKLMTPSAVLAAVIGDKPLPRTEVTKKLWEYIKKNDLQDKAKRTMINADAKLKEIFKKAQVSMFEMTKLVSAHLK